jgi:hypothetical protein
VQQASRILGKPGIFTSTFIFPHLMYDLLIFWVFDERYSWAVGDAWGYRRHAYAAMSSILKRERGLNIAAEMHSAVYSSEPPEFRDRLTARTPPLSEAARAAHSAIGSALL